MESNDTVKSLPFYTLLQQGLLIAAFTRLKRYAEKKMLWELSDKLKSLEQTYLFMIKYALSRTPDPSRDQLKRNIVVGLADIYDAMRRRADSVNSSNIYFSTLRSAANHRLDALASEYAEQRRRSADHTLSGQPASTDGAIALAEGLERDIFNLVWVTYPLSEADSSIIDRLLADDATPLTLKQMISGALALGDLRYHDDRRTRLLAKIYMTALDESLQLSALTGLMLTLWINRQRPLSEATEAMIASLRELPRWKSDLEAVTLELVRTLDTKRISDTMTDYFTNTFSKVGDQVRKSIGDLSKIEDLTELEENPEWMEMLEKTGIADKMKELTEIQEEGGDVFLQPFKQLKGDSFFYEAANWFMPFTPSNSAVRRIDPDGTLSEMVAQTPFLCDNDKYSFMLAMSRIPQEQRQMMLQQLEAGNMASEENRVTSLDTDIDRRRRIVNKTVQGLYRFFNLYRRRDDFTNPFASEIDLTELTIIADDFTDSTIVGLIGEFYFKHKYYTQALSAMLRTEQLSMPDAQLYQKIGYCLQQTGDIARALEYYEQAELLDGRSVWTLRRIAQCHRLLGHTSQALDYYQRIDQADPDRISTLMAMARCLIDMRRYTDAMQHLFKVNYLKPEHQEAQRLLAWCHFAKGDKEKAARMIFTDPILSAHLLLIDGSVEEAVAMYTSGMATDDDFSRIVGTITDDYDILRQYGLTEDMRDLLIEAITYRASNAGN